jgi:hypothetical protein
MDSRSGEAVFLAEFSRCCRGRPSLASRSYKRPERDGKAGLTSPSSKSPRSIPRPECCTAHIVIAKRVCGVALDNIVNNVVSSYGGEVSELTQERLLNYMRLLASTGKTDEQLLAFGMAYLREILEPDPRHSGC